MEPSSHYHVCIDFDEILPKKLRRLIKSKMLRWIGRNDNDKLYANYVYLKLKFVFKLVGAELNDTNYGTTHSFLTASCASALRKFCHQYPAEDDYQHVIHFEHDFPTSIQFPLFKIAN